MRVDFKKLIERLGSNDPLLEKLDLKDNVIDDQKAKTLFDALKTNTFLKELDLSLNQISVDGAEFLAEYLGLNPTLEKLNLSLNQISDKALLKITESLKVNTNLQAIYLNGNQITDKGAKRFAGFLKENPSLAAVDFGRNRITDKGFTHLFEALKQNSTLTFIGLASRVQPIFNAAKISERVVKSVIEVLKVNPVLTSLDLSGNQISDQSLILLTEVLKSNCNLTFLKLANNKIGDLGAQNLSDFLKSNKTLVGLDLSSNKISSQGSEHLAVALIENNSLSRLEGLSDPAIDRYTKVNSLLSSFNYSKKPQAILCQNLIFLNKSAFDNYRIIQDEELVIPDLLMSQLVNAFSIDARSVEESLISFDDAAQVIKKSPDLLAHNFNSLKDLQEVGVIKIQELELPKSLNQGSSDPVADQASSSTPIIEELPSSDKDPILFFAKLSQQHIKDMTPEEFEEMKTVILRKLSESYQLQSTTGSPPSSQVIRPTSIVFGTQPQRDFQKT